MGDSFAARRGMAHAVMLGAAAIITMLAAALATALVIFGGQSLPLAARHDLVTAQGTPLTLSGSVDPGQFAASDSQLSQLITTALRGTPVTLISGQWSDPLGLVSGALPHQPTGIAHGDTPLLEAAAFQDVTAHAVLIGGTWPGAAGQSAAGQPIPAAAPTNVASLLHLTIGDQLKLRDRVSGRLIRFRITGIYAQDKTTGSYWDLNTIPASGSETSSGFTTYGPMVVSSAAFTSLLTTDEGSWVAQPDMAAFNASDMTATATRVSGLQSTLSNGSQLSGLTLSTSLPSVLNDTASNLAVARSLLVIGGIQLLFLTAAALLAVARLLTSQREPETALLGSRGATRRQLLRLAAVEIMPMSLIAAAIGAFAGIWLAVALAQVGPLGVSKIGVSTASGSTLIEAIIAAVGAAMVAMILLLLPQARGSAPGEVRISRGRQAALAGASRTGADVALIALAVLSGWQLRKYSASPSSGTGGIDPVLAIAPALALAGGTVAMLRLLPAGAKLGDRLAARGRGLSAPLASWRFSRQPLRQGGSALLIVLAVATGTLALSQHASWARSASDQANFTAGANVRADLPVQLGLGQAASLPGHAMAASVQTASDVLAIDAVQASHVALVRSDETTGPAAALYREIEPATTQGVPVPGDTLRLTATLTGEGLAPMEITVTVMDSHGEGYQLGAGTVSADGRPQQLSVSVGPDERLIAVSGTYTMPVGKTRGAKLVVTPAGGSLSTWSASVSSPGLTGLQEAQSPLTPHALPRATSFTDGVLSFSPGYGESINATLPVSYQTLPGQIEFTAAHPDLLQAIPAIATSAYVNSNSLHVGSTTNVTIDGITVPVTIVATVTTYPTVSTSSGALIMDLPELQEYLASQATTPAQVTEWWLPARGSFAFPPGTVLTERATLAATITDDPVSLAPQQALLATAGAAALLAIAGFWVSIVASARQRRAETALLAALGVGRRAAAWQLTLEKLVLSVPSAALGLVLGAVLAELLVPAVTLTSSGTQPVPPPWVVLDLSQAIPLAIAISVLPSLAAAIAMLRRPDPAAELRATEAAP